MSVYFGLSTQPRRSAINAELFGSQLTMVNKVSLSGPNSNIHSTTEGILVGLDVIPLIDMRNTVEKDKPWNDDHRALVVNFNFNGDTYRVAIAHSGVGDIGEGEVNGDLVQIHGIVYDLLSLEKIFEADLNDPKSSLKPIKPDAITSTGPRPPTPAQDQAA